MTARTANEQRIAALEAEVADLLAVIPRLLRVIEALMPGLKHIAIEDYQELNEAPIAARDALSDSTDYANKVVVKKAEWEAMKKAVRRFRGLLPDEPARLTENSPTKSDGPFQIAPMKVSHMLEVVNIAWSMDNPARLDSLRKADAATDAVHPEGGKQ